MVIPQPPSRNRRCNPHHRIRQREPINHILRHPKCTCRFCRFRRLDSTSRCISAGSEHAASGWVAVWASPPAWAGDVRRVRLWEDEAPAKPGNGTSNPVTIPSGLGRSLAFPKNISNCSRGSKFKTRSKGLIPHRTYVVSRTPLPLPMRFSEDTTRNKVVDCYNSRSQP